MVRMLLANSGEVRKKVGTGEFMISGSREGPNTRPSVASIGTGDRQYGAKSAILGLPALNKETKEDS